LNGKEDEVTGKRKEKKQACREVGDDDWGN
jgi:hypothetical protein